MIYVAQAGDTNVEPYTFSMRLVYLIPGWGRQTLHAIITSSEKSRTQHINDNMKTFVEHLCLLAAATVHLATFGSSESPDSYPQVDHEYECCTDRK